MPAQGDAALGAGAAAEPHAAGGFGDVEPGELAVGGVEELDPVAVGVGRGVEGRGAAAPVDKDGIDGGRLEGGGDGRQGLEGGAVEAGGALDAVLEGAGQVAGGQADGSRPAEGDLAALGVGGVDGDLGDDGHEQGQLLADGGRGQAHAAVEAAVAVGVAGHQHVAVGDAPAQAGRVGEGGGRDGQLSDLTVARWRAGGARLRRYGGTAFPAVDEQAGGLALGSGGGAGVGRPAKLDGPALGGGRGAGGEVFDRGPHDADAQGLEGDQTGGRAAGGHVTDLEGDVVGGTADVVAVGLPGEGRGGGLVLGQAVAGKSGVVGGDQLARSQGSSIGSDVEDAPESRDDDAVVVGVGG
ncbi:hypothetical protein [Spirosoma montaniterrae]|uniref:hypothetical protein n=1 Tax=Spirosoma montaniterrae TaxID=1178516 RepID=UPI001E32D809|nr:hypothetical protein [Spirosoma montaniterrae]